MVHWKKGARKQLVIPKVFYPTTCSRQMRVTIQVPKARFSIFIVTRPVTGEFDHQETAKNLSLPSLFDPLTLALSILIYFIYLSSFYLKK